MTRYFDHNATAPPAQGLHKVCAEVLGLGASNASSVHALGRRAKAIIERVRRQVAASIGGDADGVRFTSGATESIHEFIEGYLKPGDEVVVCPVEHPAVHEALGKVGAAPRYMRLDSCGRVDLGALSEMVTEKTRLVVVMMAQNEFGNIYPVSEIAEMVSPVPVFTDAVQAYGKEPIDVRAMGVAGLAVSAHKIGGLAGTGALWVREDIALRRRTVGGGQERGRRGGTENLMGIACMGVAVEGLDERLAAAPRLTAYREQLITALRSIEGSLVIGDPVHCLVNTLLFSVPGVDGDLIVQALDLEGICVSTGSACSSGSVEPSASLRALGLTEEEARGAVRISMGPETTHDDVVVLAKVLLNRLKDFSSTARSKS